MGIEDSHSQQQGPAWRLIWHPRSACAPATIAPAHAPLSAFARLGHACCSWLSVAALRVSAAWLLLHRLGRPIISLLAAGDYISFRPSCILKKMLPSPHAKALFSPSSSSHTRTSHVCPHITIATTRVHTHPRSHPPRRSHARVSVCVHSCCFPPLTHPPLAEMMLVPPSQ